MRARTWSVVLFCQPRSVFVLLVEWGVWTWRDNSLVYATVTTISVDVHQAAVKQRAGRTKMTRPVSVLHTAVSSTYLLGDKLLGINVWIQCTCTKKALENKKKVSVSLPMPTSKLHRMWR